ncbi:MAG: glycosyltransferase family 39 protein [Cyanobacteria bacterium J06642_2]
MYEQPRLNPASPWQWILVTLIVAGVGFRCANLDLKPYSHDEAYTSLRAVGQTRLDFDDRWLQNRVATVADLRNYQTIQPGSTTADTVRSLYLEDAQHPPLYFLLTRGWMQLFGDSVTATRSLAVLFSLLALPLMYVLGVEIFANPLAGWLAMVAFALGPFDIHFAQTARQYSLVTGTILLSSIFLLRAVRTRQWGHWFGYIATATIALYTHPFFILNAIAHGAYCFLLGLFSINHPQTPLAARRNQLRVGGTGLFVSSAWQPFWQYFRAMLAVTLLYGPWLWVVYQRRAQVAVTTSWAHVDTTWLHRLERWVFSFTVPTFDLDLFADPLGIYILGLPTLGLLVLAFWLTIRKTHPTTWLFLLATALVPLLVLLAPDLLRGGIRSVIPRYLLGCFPAVWLALGFWMSVGLSQGSRSWKSLVALVLVGSVVSNAIGVTASTWWSKDVSYDNAAIIEQLNAAKAPTLVSDIGAEYTNSGDLWALSHSLDDDVSFLLLSTSPDISALERDRPAFAFRPSARVREALETHNWQLEPLIDDNELYGLQPS